MSERNGVDPDDLRAVRAFESWLDPSRQNSYGATGLIQFMTDTADRTYTSDACAINI